MKDKSSAKNGDLIFFFHWYDFWRRHDKSNEAAQAIIRIGSSIHGCQDESYGLVIRGLHLVLPPAAGYPRKRFKIGIVLTRSPMHRLAA